MNIWSRYTMVKWEVWAGSYPLVCVRARHAIVARMIAASITGYNSPGLQAYEVKL